MVPSTAVAITSSGDSTPGGGAPICRVQAPRMSIRARLPVASNADFKRSKYFKVIRHIAFTRFVIIIF